MQEQAKNGVFWQNSEIQRLWVRKSDFASEKIWPVSWQKWVFFGIYRSIGHIFFMKKSHLGPKKRQF